VSGCLNARSGSTILLVTALKVQQKCKLLFTETVIDRVTCYQKRLIYWNCHRQGYVLSKTTELQRFDVQIRIIRPPIKKLIKILKLKFHTFW